MSSELKPCPFCGGVAEHRPKGTFNPPFVECRRGCGATAFSGEMWNTRAPSPAVKALVEACKATLRAWMPCGDQCECSSCEQRAAIDEALAAVEREIGAQP